MSFESDFFKRKRVDFDKLLPFGFVAEGDGFLYRATIMDGAFEARVRIDGAGQVSGALWDLDMDEDYAAYRVTAPAGAFVGEVREAYGQILSSIAQHCFLDMPLVSDQGNDLAQHISQKYGDSYDHPFDKYPKFLSYRNPSNNKWYALFMTLAREKLDLGDELWDQEALKAEVEIVNLKVDPNRMADLQAQAGIYPSYHMNKKSWVSVVLDGTVPQDLLADLVDNSRALTMPVGYRSQSGPDYWVIPANPKYFDIDAEFAESKVVYWTQKAKIQKGDLVFMYVTAPVQAIRYVCRCLEAEVDNTIYPDYPDIKKLMKVELILTFDDSLFPFETMKELGVRAVRGPRRMTKELIEAVQKELPE